MMRRFAAYSLSGIWGHVAFFCFILLFVSMGDSILSYWVPNFLEETFKSPLAMGLIMSFSSVVGFSADLLVPQLMKKVYERRLLVSAIILTFVFSGLLFAATFFPWVVICLIAMGVWGIYYEFIGFSKHQFVARRVPGTMRSAVWAIFTATRSVSYFIGPILAGFLFSYGSTKLILMASMFSFVGLVASLFLSRKNENYRHYVGHRHSGMAIFREAKDFKGLFKYVWPMFLLAIYMSFVDAMFWTTGAVLSETLSEANFWGQFFLPLYMLPSIFMGFIVARLKIYRGKKKKAERAMVLSSIVLFTLGFLPGVYAKLLAVAVSSVLFWFASPLVDAVFTDLAVRLGDKQTHLMAMSNSTLSVAYIVGPTLCGLMATLVGESMVFSLTGLFGIAMCWILLVLTPRKIKLPKEFVRSLK